MIAAMANRHSATSTLISTVKRGFMLKALGSHPGAIRKGCVTRPIERISRRSWVHRLTIGELASPLVTLRGSSLQPSGIAPGSTYLLPACVLALAFVSGGDQRRKPDSEGIVQGTLPEFPLRSGRREITALTGQESTTLLPRGAGRVLGQRKTRRSGRVRPEMPTPAQFPARGLLVLKTA